MVIAAVALDETIVIQIRQALGFHDLYLEPSNYPNNPIRGLFPATTDILYSRHYSQKTSAMPLSGIMRQTAFDKPLKVKRPAFVMSTFGVLRSISGFTRHSRNRRYENQLWSFLLQRELINASRVPVYLR